VSLDERFARWRRKHSGMTAALAVGRERAAELESEICGLAHIEPDDVRRLPWAEEAVREARALETTGAADGAEVADDPDAATARAAT
jgi:hypothetical protein